MHDEPRQTLYEIIAQYGHAVRNEPGRCEGLLRDFCRGAYRREIFALMSALREQVVTDLLASWEGVPPEVVLARLTQRLETNLGLAPETARWAVESWAVALGKLSLQELTPPRAGEERQCREQTEAAQHRTKYKRQHTAQAGAKPDQPKDEKRSNPSMFGSFFIALLILLPIEFITGQSAGALMGNEAAIAVTALVQSDGDR